MSEAAKTTSAPAAADPGRKSMDDIMALCKRRGFIYQASEIYGGINGFWDYGPLGAQLKKNLKDAWWQDSVLTPPMGPDGREVEMVGIDTCIIQHPKVWEASGHIAGFNDPMVDDKETKQRFRADHIYGIYVAGCGQQITEKAIRDTGDQWGLEDVRQIGSTVAVPNFTVIASSEGEAISLLLNDKSTQKRLHIKSAALTDDGEVIVKFAPSARERLSPMPEAPVSVNVFFVTWNLLRNYPLHIPSPFTNRTDVLTAPRQFNLMFQTFVGATATEDDVAYLRPETAQGIFVQFKNVVDTSRVRVPFGIAQMGKAFRNEVTPRNFTFRSREFEQMEIEFFCHKDDAAKWYAFWRDFRLAWWKSIGLGSDNLQLREHDKNELAHYAKEGAGTSDIEYRFPFTYPGFGELEGVADRSDYDLRQHQEHARVKLEYFDTERGELAPNGQPKGERYLPNVIEPSAGADRGVLAVLCEAYTPDDTRPSKVYMKFHPRIAPIKAAVFPLVNKDGMPEVAEKLARDLKKRFAIVEYDAKQSIGKRYARMDEAGCPFCFTIDGDTLSDNSVTVRHRDTQKQERIGIDAVATFLQEQLGV